jgi:hypothetical protein
MKRKYLTLGIIVPLAAAGAFSAAPVASAVSTPKVAAFHSMFGWGSCTMGSTVSVNAIPIAGQTYVDVRIRDGTLFPPKQMWFVSITQRKFGSLFEPNFTAIKQTNSFGQLRVQVLTEPIVGGLNFFKVTAHNLTTTGHCSTPFVPA